MRETNPESAATDPTDGYLKLFEILQNVMEKSNT